MKVIADLSVIPIGVGISLSKYIAACEKVLSEAGLKTKLHAYGTNIEGDWDAVFAAIKRCHEVLHEMGAPRVSAVIFHHQDTKSPRENIMRDPLPRWEIARKLHLDDPGRFLSSAIRSRVTDTLLVSWWLKSPISIWRLRVLPRSRCVGAGEVLSVRREQIRLGR